MTQRATHTDRLTVDDIGEGPSGRRIADLVADGMRVADYLVLEDANEIARRCNAHTDLLAACEEIIAWMKTAHSADAMAPGGWPMIDRARAAIAKARGKE